MYESAVMPSDTMMPAMPASDSAYPTNLPASDTIVMAKMAQKMGLKTRVSTNPAMTLGGLKEGVTPLEMAYAYSTIANYGKRISGNFAA